ncbi:hypothetical protein [Paraburkholderia unamae]|jgi:hypothetical protein|uniref:Uncharacterized protein n=1 Tax=Paraburkholderia unamae TaxID=219649 RepID=A0ABX5KPY4_9BURK|nr:hypothetical protein [Paraburkholderia unamae]PVX84540.1 hypothetical protein C7402_105381 [Paraburkholderia unamae]RAR51872.1 hypothetical protein C7401_13535 [Paraburkholderia unamae]CAG9248446.1 conserved hypothetical protein [Paraburkholderia unamae]
MESAQKSHGKIEVKLFLHPNDHHRAMVAAKALNLAEREFYALALHLGSNQILRQAEDV